MSDSITDLLQEYDELVTVVSSSRHNLYQMALARWFSLIDDTPAFARACSRLESMNDFNSWYEELQDRQQSHGMGSAPLNLPVSREAATGMQLALFRRMSKGEIDAAMFAHTHLSTAERDLNANVNVLGRVVI